MTDLNGKTALVTGGGTGIGEGIALALGKLEVKVVVCGRRVEPLEKVIEEIKSGGGEGFAVQGDAADEKDVDRIVEAARKAFGTVDILINNAGIYRNGRIAEHKIKAWDEVMDINLRGPFLFSRAVLPEMQKQGYGHIINISSESGIEYYLASGTYGVSKHALNALNEFIQRENQEYDIRVDSICPGMVVTEMTEDSPGLDHDKCLYPEDIADLAVFLLTRRKNIKISTPIMIQTMLNPWE
jgi:NADP-dependent 3-hydroxy acid dehydrogenase YdfG